MKDKKQAFAYYDKALSMTDDKYKIYICYAISLTEFKEFDAAIEMFKKAIDFDAKQSNAYVLLANLYSSLGRIKEAVDFTEKHFKSEPNNPETYMLLGNAHYLDKDIEQAISSYRASISIAAWKCEYRLIYSQVMDDYVKSVRGEA